MTLRRVTGPGLPLTVEAAKSNGRIDIDAEDALVEGHIKAALAHAEKWTGATFQAQVWELVIDAFPEAEIAIPKGRVTSITSVGYIDTDGHAQTTADYETDLTPHDRAWVIPTGPWPATMATVNAVTVRFTVGDVPPDDVRQALLLLTEHYYENRAATSDQQMREIPIGVYGLLAPHRNLFV